MATPQLSQPLMRADREAQEQEKALAENNENNLELCLKASCFGIALLVTIIIIIVIKPNGTACASNRIAQMETEILGLESIWAVPENALLNAKYAALHRDLQNYGMEVHSMSKVYSNITEIKDKLGRVRKQIQDIHILKDKGIDAIKEVNETLARLKSYTATIDERLKEGLKKISANAVDMAKEAVVPAVDEMRKNIDASERKSQDDLHQDLSDHWKQIDARVARLNATLDEKSKAMSAKVDEQTASLEKSVDARIQFSKTSISKALTIASEAKAAGDDARTTAETAIASIKGVGFIKHAGGACPEGSEECTLWHWMAPQPMDPFCSMAKKNDTWADGRCALAGNGELSNWMLGCCRK